MKQIMIKTIKSRERKTKCNGTNTQKEYHKIVTNEMKTFWRKSKPQRTDNTMIECHKRNNCIYLHMCQCTISIQITHFFFSTRNQLRCASSLTKNSENWICFSFCIIILPAMKCTKLKATHKRIRMVWGAYKKKKEEKEHVSHPYILNNKRATKKQTSKQSKAKQQKPKIRKISNVTLLTIDANEMVWTMPI